MRVNLITQASAASFPGTRAIPLSLTIRPACGLPGDYEYQTDSSALLQMLKQHTDLPASVLQRFEGNMYGSGPASLLGVDLSERVLTNIGYFID
jgi:hypothetical protein